MSPPAVVTGADSPVFDGGYSTLSEGFVDSGGQCLRDVRASPGERRACVDAETREDAGERLGLAERARHLLVSRGLRRRVCVDDRLERSALGLELGAHGR